MPMRVSMWKKHYVHQHVVYVMAAANAWTDPKLQQTLLTVIGHEASQNESKRYPRTFGLAVCNRYRNLGRIEVCILGKTFESSIIIRINLC